MQPIIKLESVNFHYDPGKPSEVYALKNVNLEIFPGEYISFFGPSGCGKSTLLYVIAGVERPDEGKVIINGQDLMEFSQRELAIYRQVGIGIIFQNFNLIPSIKNIDNITLPMNFLGIAPVLKKKRGMEILEQLLIADLANRFPHELSGGQQQRVAIARALVMNPAIILADEPTGNIASVQAEEVMAIFKKLNKEGRTIVMITHEPDIAEHAQRIIHLKDGKIVGQNVSPRT